MVNRPDSDFSKGDEMKVPLPKVVSGRVLADWVTVTLQEAILKGHFEAGEKLDQDLIAEELKVSRTPVREALKVLESEGFVDIRPHRGAFIATVSRQDIHEIYEVRCLLEAEIVRQITPSIPEALIEQLTASLNEMKDKLITTGDRTGQFENDVYFHDAIVNLTQNKLLKEMLEGLNKRISRIRRYAQLQPTYHLVESIEEHLAILQAMKNRDAETAAQALSTHLEKSALRIQQFIPK